MSDIAASTAIDIRLCGLASHKKTYKWSFRLSLPQQAAHNWRCLSWICASNVPVHLSTTTTERVRELSTRCIDPQKYCVLPLNVPSVFVEAWRVLALCWRGELDDAFFPKVRTWLTKVTPQSCKVRTQSFRGYSRRRTLKCELGQSSHLGIST